MAKELWTEKYRPNTVEGYVFRDESQKRQVQTWIKDQSIPHLLLSGSPGIGKTTLAKLLLNEIIFFLKLLKLFLEIWLLE
jgi:replication factor C small subunit